MASLVPRRNTPQFRLLMRGVAAAFASFALLTAWCLVRSYMETCCASLTVSSRWGASATIAWGGFALILWSRRRNLCAAAVEGPRSQVRLFILLAAFASAADLASFQLVALGGGSPQGPWEMMERLVGFLPRAGMVSALLLLALIVWQQRSVRVAPILVGQDEAWLAFPEEPLLRLRPRDVAMIRSAGNYSEIAGTSGSYLVRVPISQLEGRLASRGFARVHRGAIVNLRHVRALRRDTSGRPVLLLSGGEQIAVGRSYRSRIGGLMPDCGSDEVRH
jgi:hypothetical protein